MDIKPQDLDYSYSETEEDSQVIESKADQMWNKIIQISKQYAKNLAELRITEKNVDELRKSVIDANELYDKIFAIRSQYSTTLESIKVTRDSDKMDVDGETKRTEDFSTADQKSNMIL